MSYSTPPGVTAAQLASAEAATAASVEALIPTGAAQLSYAQKTIKSGDTISNTTAKTAFASQIVMPANAWIAPQVYKLEGSGTYTAALLTTGTTTCGFQLLNAVTSALTQLITSPSLSNAINLSSIPFDFNIDILIASIVGNVATAKTSGTLIFNTALNLSETIALAPVTTTFDPTVQQTLQCFTQFSIASPSISSTLQSMFMLGTQAAVASN